MLEEVSSFIRHAAATGRAKDLLHLLKEWADHDVIDEPDRQMGKTALMEAAEKGHLQCVRLLVEGGAALDSTSHFDYTAVMFAAACGHADVVRYLARSGADLDRQEKVGGLTAAMKAASMGQMRCVDHLATFGADLDIVDACGHSAIDWAVRELSRASRDEVPAYQALVDLLLRKGCRIGTDIAYTSPPRVGKSDGGDDVKVKVGRQKPPEPKLPPPLALVSQGKARSTHGTTPPPPASPPSLVVQPPTPDKQTHSQKETPVNSPRTTALPATIPPPTTPPPPSTVPAAILQRTTPPPPSTVPPPPSTDTTCVQGSTRRGSKSPSHLQDVDMCSVSPVTVTVPGRQASPPPPLTELSPLPAGLPPALVPKKSRVKECSISPGVSVKQQKRHETTLPLTDMPKPPTFRRPLVGRQGLATDETGETAIPRVLASYSRSPVSAPTGQQVSLPRSDSARRTAPRAPGEPKSKPKAHPAASSRPTHDRSNPMTKDTTNGGTDRRRRALQLNSLSLKFDKSPERTEPVPEPVMEPVRPSTGGWQALATSDQVMLELLAEEQRLLVALQMDTLDHMYNGEPQQSESQHSQEMDDTVRGDAGNGKVSDEKSEPDVTIVASSVEGFLALDNNEKSSEKDESEDEEGVHKLGDKEDKDKDKVRDKGVKEEVEEEVEEKVMGQRAVEVVLPPTATIFLPPAPCSDEKGSKQKKDLDVDSDRVTPEGDKAGGRSKDKGGASCDGDSDSDSSYDIAWDSSNDIIEQTPVPDSAAPEVVEWPKKKKPKKIKKTFVVPSGVCFSSTLLEEDSDKEDSALPLSNDDHDVHRHNNSKASVQGVDEKDDSSSQSTPPSTRKEGLGQQQKQQQNQAHEEVWERKAQRSNSVSKLTEHSLLTSSGGSFTQIPKQHQGEEKKEGGKKIHHEEQRLDCDEQHTEEKSQSEDVELSRHEEGTTGDTEATPQELEEGPYYDKQELQQKGTGRDEQELQQKGTDHDELEIQQKGTHHDKQEIQQRGTDHDTQELQPDENELEKFTSCQEQQTTEERENAPAALRSDPSAITDMSTFSLSTCLESEVGEMKQKDSDADADHRELPELQQANDEKEEISKEPVERRRGSILRLPTDPPRVSSPQQVRRVSFNASPSLLVYDQEEGHGEGRDSDEDEFDTNAPIGGASPPPPPATHSPLNFCTFSADPSQPKYRRKTTFNSRMIYYPYEELRDSYPEQIDITKKELYLRDDEFQHHFGMSKEEYKTLPKWKADRLKRDLGLF
eukprot:CAMPEP_0114439102 /NCGR_PEP_ID=MMETSP0103-20121206/15011_1 /TAXON_ID=37642 ORGANISM="Paraphysomonas imperforata, Strain PA2" /NCGR_SAMPLE_ID=MMETSP0103 /ASSEMBLY_ACC=CAM_ASM_000201 /LENGTH=1253 /DNA_ID=CAMNT_0001609825 /DNA_START=129 /DNA_END=3890 /DNA_ORIENTATION=-